MTMTKIIELDGVSLTVRPATAADSLRREMLIARAVDNPMDDETEQAMALVFFPRCVCCTTGTVNGVDARTMTAREFCDLPAEIFETWWSAVMEENPRWSISGADADNQKKT